MRYANIKLPDHVLFMDTDEDVQEVLKAVVGHECKLIDTPAIGYSNNGSYEEGDIWYEDNGYEYQLSYDFNVDAGRIFRYEIQWLGFTIKA